MVAAEAVDVAPVAHSQADAHNRTVGPGVDENRVMAGTASRMWSPKNKRMLPWSPVWVSWNFIQTATVSYAARPTITHVSGPIPSCRAR